ncbi:AAA family ATPase [Zymobacter sp. IVIA_12111.31 C1]|uniref:AAA family ATPase n=1 Tax=Zymobacter sp. IVIA_12111.31 C1 TaxID=3394854 RepID=UPI0039C39575
MKILTLRLCNLAAFAGEHTLDFTRSPLSECGLFAITGPTGSGKSTLLDAMCLALFGSTPRLRQMPGAGTLPQDDSVQLRDPRTLLRRGCTHAFAEVTLMGVDNLRYTASWSVRRARNSVTGKIQNSAQVLRRLDPEEQLITDGKQDFSRKLPEVLGLSFDQFTRAVLLAQAEFSAFLKANDNDRSALLERLTDSDIYSRISRRAYQQYRETKQQHAELATHLEQTRPCDETERAQLDNAVHQAHSDLEHHRAQLTALEEQHRQLNQRRTLVHDYHSQQQAFAALDQQWRQCEDQREQCVALDRFAAIRETLQECRDQQQRHKALSEEEQRRTLAVESAASATALTEQAWSQTRQQRQRLEEQQREEAPRLDAALALEQQLQHLRQQRKETTDLLAALDKQQRLRLEQLKQLDDAHHDDHSRLNALRQQRALLTTLPPSQRLHSLRQRISALDQQRQRWIKRQDTAQRLASHQQQLDDYLAQQQQADATLSQRQQCCQQAEQALTHAANHHQRLHDALLAYSEQTLAALRHLLSDSAPCPVCGSSEHTPPPPTAMALVEAQREAARQQLEPARQALETAREQYENAQQQRHQAELALTKAKAHSEQAHQIVVQLMATETVYPLIHCQSRVDGIQQRHQRATRQVEALDDCIARIHSLEEQLQDAEQQRQRLEGAQQHGSAQRLDVEHQYERLEQRIEAEQTKLSDQLGTHTSARAWKTARDAALQQARDSEQTALEQFERCRTEQDSTRRAQQEHHAQWLTHCSRMETLTAQVDEWRAAQPPAWQSDEALTRLLAITPHEHHALKETLTRLDNARHDADIRQRTYRQQCDIQLDDDQYTLLDTPATLLNVLDEQLIKVDERQQAQRQQVEAHQERHEAARSRQREDDQRRQRYAELTDQHQHAEQELERWGKISGLIGSADGALFRKMAQQWHLDMLVVHANHHLQTLARRFSLKRGGTELGLMIVDREMGDEERSVHSLSGGETFLVSLALALGLAAMASDRLLIGTLFIDEGFGSLDTRARAMAMDALEALQAQGRQVGIISHVQELHERIPVQVQVCPGGREGSSHLKISSPRSLLDLG